MTTLSPPCVTWKRYVGALCPLSWSLTSEPYANRGQGRVWTLITPAFSHQSVVHLMFNRYAQLVLRVVGSKSYVASTRVPAWFCGLSARKSCSCWVRHAPSCSILL